MIDVGGRRSWRGGPELAGVAAVASPAALRAGRRRDPRPRASSPPSCASGWPPRRSPGRGLRRRGRGLPEPHHRHPLPPRLTLVLEKRPTCRYGENPHQRAALYRETTHRAGTLADATQLQGATPTFNDLLDLDAAAASRPTSRRPPSSIVKPTDPVGLASADDLAEAYRRALETDPVNAFGAIVGANRRSTSATARAIAATRTRPSSRPATTRRPWRILRAKQELEVLSVPATRRRACATTASPTSTSSGSAAACLSRRATRSGIDRGELRVVTHRRPTLEELTDLLFAWRAVRPRPLERGRAGPERATVGIGAGQASRLVDRDRPPSGRRAGQDGCLASDAYFPFADASIAAQRGVTAIIQPGGSRRDEMAIEVADRHHMAMVFTGSRHFRR